MTGRTASQASPSRAEIVIRGASVIDGTGAPRFAADVSIVGDRIAAVGDLARVAGDLEIDAAGLVLAPGFIDTHAHDDRAVFADPEMPMKTSQGVTSVVFGNCGFSLAPLTIEGDVPSPLNLIGRLSDFEFPSFADYAAKFERHPPALNAACLVGHSTLRIGAVAALDRAATDAEIDVMRDRVKESMEAGAIGVSSGLFYPPAAAATLEETAAVVEVAGEAGGIYTAHIRDEGDDIVPALHEALEIGRRGGAPVVISHHKVAGAQNFGRTVETLGLIDEAHKTQAVALDVYPYIAASSWLNPGYFSLCQRITLTWSEPHPEMAGQDIADIAREWGVSDEEAGKRLQPGGAIYFLMDEADLQRVLSHPNAMIGSDGIPDDEHPHPRLWGTFPRVLGHYSRDLGLFGLEDAVRRMTSLPARVFGFSNRGEIGPGFHADLVLFDPAAIRDAATYADPQTPAVGIDLVMVNGQIVFRTGTHTSARPGRMLRREPAVAA